VRGAGRSASALPGDVVAEWLRAILDCFPFFVSCFPCDWLILFIKQLVIECLTKKCLQAVFLVHNCLAEGNNNLGLNFSPPLSLSYHRRWRCCLGLKGKVDYSCFRVWHWRGNSCSAKKLVAVPCGPGLYFVCVLVLDHTKVCADYRMW